MRKEYNSSARSLRSIPDGFDKTSEGKRQGQSRQFICRRDDFSFRSFSYDFFKRNISIFLVSNFQIFADRKISESSGCPPRPLGDGRG